MAPDERLLAKTSILTAAYLRNHQLAGTEIPALIRSIHDALAACVGTAAPQQPEQPPQPATTPAPMPAVPINQSVTEDYLICLEDGAKLKMLKRYLRTHYDMTPEEYRKRWGLGPDYPMVAPSSTRLRRANTKG